MLRRGLWALAILVGLAAVGLILWQFWPWGMTVRARPVPEGDQEVAWVNTSTADANWERFVAGIWRAQRLGSGTPWEIDDSAAYPIEATAVPEVVVRRPGQSGALRIRWYKTTSDVHSRDWVRRLTEREPPPLAVIGGGFSDRALELARALADARAALADPDRAPLLLLTTATAVTTRLDDPAGGTEDETPDNLIRRYRGRTFRFCFNNQQMARTVLDFVRRSPDLRPQLVPPEASAAATVAAAAGGPWPPALAAAAGPAVPVPWLLASYADDPYSVDLEQRFLRLLRPPEGEPVRHILGRLPFSAGGYYRPRRDEVDIAASFLIQIAGGPARAGLVLPTGVAPSRRLLTALTGLDPLVGKRLVVVTGDSLSFNSVYRDGELTFNSRMIPVPLVFFAHANPVAWDPDDSGPYALRPPNATDDVILNAELVWLLTEAALPPDRGGPLGRASELAERLRASRLPPTADAPAGRPFFRESGNRGDGGEYVVCLLPFLGPAASRAPAALAVWHRPEAGAGWRPVPWRDDTPSQGDRPEPAAGGTGDGPR